MLANKEYLKYFDGFEIIDEKFATFLKQKFDQLSILSVVFKEIEDKYFLNITNEEQNFYEIVSLDSKNNFNFEYLIKIRINITFNDKNTLLNQIFDILKKNGIHSLYKEGKAILFYDNSFVFDLFYKDYTPNISDNNITTNESSLNSGSRGLEDEFSIFTPTPKEKKNFRFQFQTISNRKFEIIEVDKNTTIKELITKFFENIERLDLFGNKDIIFLCNAQHLSYESNEKISRFFWINSNDDIINIIVIDPNDDLG